MAPTTPPKTINTKKIANKTLCQVLGKKRNLRGTDEADEVGVKALDVVWGGTLPEPVEKFGRAGREDGVGF
jgi:hypothetical protein